MEAAATISKELIARVKASLERRTAKEAQFNVEGAWDEEDSELLDEEIAPEEVGVAVWLRCTAGGQVVSSSSWYHILF